MIRHRLPDRLFHWLMAASVLTLLFTGFLPILGIKFAWVTVHWIAGLVLSAALVFHIIRALFWQDRLSMWVGFRDLTDAWRAIRQGFLRPGPAPGKPGKYPFLQKMFHHGAAVIVLIAVITGILMMAKLDTPFWSRNPYFLSDQVWGVIYVLHGLASLCTITLVMVHVYFAIRPEKLWITRSMILGWITRDEYVENHDPDRWVIDSHSDSDTRTGAAAPPDAGISAST